MAHARRQMMAVRKIMNTASSVGTDQGQNSPVSRRCAPQLTADSCRDLGNAANGEFVPPIGSDAPKSAQQHTVVAPRAVAIPNLGETWPTSASAPALRRAG